MRTRMRSMVVGAVAVAAALAGTTGQAHAANPWLTAPGFLNMAHQGGELEAPGNTLYAFKTAMRDRGADSLEMDAYVTKDDQLVLLHNQTLTATSNSSQTIWDMTLAEAKQVDNSYWFSPGKGQYGHDPADSHPYRGMATGDVAPPPGYTANDFRVPTFAEVLAAFPNTRLNVDLKDQSGHVAEGVRAADAMAKLLKAQPGGDNENVLVASFGQPEMERFHELMPGHRSITASLQETSDYVFKNDPIQPTPIALQPPDKYKVGDSLIDAPEVLKPLADRDGYALHVWGADATVEDDALYQRMVDAGVQGYFSQEPAKLSAWLCTKGIVRPDGSSHCEPNARVGGIGSYEDAPPTTTPTTPVPPTTVTVTTPGPATTTPGATVTVPAATTPVPVAPVAPAPLAPTPAATPAGSALAPFPLPPAARLRVASQTLGTVLRRGLRVEPTSAAAGSLRVTVRWRGRVVGRRTLAVRAGRTALTVRLDAASRRRVARATGRVVLAVDARLRSTTGDVSTTRAQVTLRRG